MQIQRKVAGLLRSRVARYPAVALVGPRQVGKTTLARSVAESYYDLEQDADRLRLDLDWPALIAGDALVVLDEAQAWPEVFVRLRAAIDARRARTGRFLLLGSVSPALMTRVSESLAGRLSTSNSRHSSRVSCPTYHCVTSGVEVAIRTAACSIAVSSRSGSGTI